MKISKLILIIIIFLAFYIGSLNGEPCLFKETLSNGEFCVEEIYTGEIECKSYLDTLTDQEIKDEYEKRFFQ